MLAVSATLSFVLAILGASFRSLAKALLPLAVLFILAGCGGSTKAQPRQETRVVRGAGFSFAVPHGWRTSRTVRALVARPGSAATLVSVTSFTLLKPYEPALFAVTARELDGVAARLAAQGHGRVTERATTTVDGRRIRAYRLSAGTGRIRIGFVLEGRREYQLLCQAPAAAGDPDGACGLLFDSFALG